MIEPDDELRARIQAWAKKHCLDLDALEVAACKLLFTAQVNCVSNDFVRSLYESIMSAAYLPSSQYLREQEAGCATDCSTMQMTFAIGKPAFSV